MNNNYTKNRTMLGLWMEDALLHRSPLTPLAITGLDTANGMKHRFVTALANAMQVEDGTLAYVHSIELKPEQIIQVGDRNKIIVMNPFRLTPDYVAAIRQIVTAKNPKAVIADIASLDKTIAREFKVLTVADLQEFEDDSPELSVGGFVYTLFDEVACRTFPVVTRPTLQEVCDLAGRLRATLLVEGDNYHFVEALDRVAELAEAATREDSYQCPECERWNGRHGRDCKQVRELVRAL